MTNDSKDEIIERGLYWLHHDLGYIETERFISVITRGNCDYSKWRKNIFNIKEAGGSMGTRNITRVISGGVRRIEQYCQWDGKPTGHGLNVLSFSRELYKNGRVDELKEYLKTTQLINANQLDQTIFTYTCAPYNDSTDRIFDLVGRYENDHSGLSGTRAVDAMLNEGLLSMDEAKYYVTASRSVGSDLLGFLLEHEPEGMKFYTDDYLSEMPPAGDWQIEAVYIIYLDANTTEIWWHGFGITYTFDELTASTAEELKNDMFKLEHGIIEKTVTSRMQYPDEGVQGMQM